MTETPTKAKRSKAKTAGIVIGIVFAVLIGLAVTGYLVIVLGGASLSILANTPPPYVTYSGSVQTVGFRTTPAEIVFVDTVTGQRETTGADSGHYSISLPTGEHNWQVGIHWQGLAGSQGTCNAGSINYNDIMSAFQSRDFKC